VLFLLGVHSWSLLFHPLENCMMTALQLLVRREIGINCITVDQQLGDRPGIDELRVGIWEGWLANANDQDVKSGWRAKIQFLEEKRPSSNDSTQQCNNKTFHRLTLGQPMDTFLLTIHFCSLIEKDDTKETKSGGGL
jgi:hypothetical protein